MASHLPIPQPPRTPTPLSDEDNESTINLDGALDLPPLVNSNSLSPYLHSARSASSLSIASNLSLSTYPAGNASTDSLSQAPKPTSHNPFGFQTQTYTVGGRTSPTKANMGQRRGHKYKHSSVSHQIFLEPTPRGPLKLPASLPIPTVKEGWYSMSKEQRIRVAWCFCHLFVAAYVQWAAQGSLAITALSHLIFYDAVGAFLCAGIEVLSNFEVWKRPSIRHPFGLERSEVLVGFAMSIALLFMGFDLLSHNASHSLENVGNHSAHREHKHVNRVPSGSIDLLFLLVIISTLISAIMLKNHARIARSMRFASIRFLPSVVSHPSHLLTISCSTILLFMPLVSFDIYTRMDTGLSIAMACLMCALGVQLVKTLGAMLLMSFNSLADGAITSVVQEIESDPNIRAVEEAKFWQVHYGLAIATLKLRVRGSPDALKRMRERVQSLIKQKLGGSTGTGDGVVWEISTQLTLERD